MILVSGKSFNEIPETMVSGLIRGIHKVKSFNEIPETMVSGLICGIHE